MEKKRWRIKAKEGRAWIKALRSDDYIRTEGAWYRGTREDSDGRVKPVCCALGVLDHLMGEAGSTRGLSKIITCGSESSMGIASKNDKGMSFKEIADWIEENVLIAGE